MHVGRASEQREPSLSRGFLSAENDREWFFGLWSFRRNDWIEHRRSLLIRQIVPLVEIELSELKTSQIDDEGDKNFADGIYPLIYLYNRGHNYIWGMLKLFRREWNFFSTRLRFLLICSFMECTVKLYFYQFHVRNRYTAIFIPIIIDSRNNVEDVSHDHETTLTSRCNIDVITRQSRPRHDANRISFPLP